MNTQPTRDGYPPTPSIFHRRVLNTLSGLEERPARPVRRPALILVVALLLTLLVAIVAVATNTFGILDFLRGFAREPVFLDSAGELVQQDVATLTLAETELNVHEVLCDGRTLHILYTITDLDGAPITSEADLTGQLWDPYVLTHAAKRDGLVGMVLELELNGDSVPFGSYFFPGENPGEMVYWLEADIQALSLDDTFEVGLPAVMNEDGWYEVPEALRFPVSKARHADVRSFSVSCAPISFEDHTVTVTGVFQSPLRLYVDAVVTPDDGLSARRLREIQAAWSAGGVYAPDGTLVAEPGGGLYRYTGDPLAEMPAELTLRNSDGTRELTVTIEEEAP